MSKAFKSPKNIPTKEQLLKYYVEEDLPISYTAERLGASKESVRRKLHEYGIPLKPRGRIYGPGADEYRRRKSKPKPIEAKTKPEPDRHPLITVHAGGRVEGNYWQNLNEFEADRARSKMGGVEK